MDGGRKKREERGRRRGRKGRKKYSREEAKAETLLAEWPTTSTTDFSRPPENFSLVSGVSPCCYCYELLSLLLFHLIADAFDPNPYLSTGCTFWYPFSPGVHSTQSCTQYIPLSTSCFRSQTHPRSLILRVPDGKLS